MFAWDWPRELAKTGQVIASAAHCKVKGFFKELTRPKDADVVLSSGRATVELPRMQAQSATRHANTRLLCTLCLDRTVA